MKTKIPPPALALPFALPFTADKLPNRNYEVMDEHGVSLGAHSHLQAKFLCNAINSHAALVEACESFMEDWRDLESDYANTPVGHTAKAVKSALALARGDRRER